LRAPMRRPAEPGPIRQLRLPDGQTLVWAEYGDGSGTPILYHHGWPGSRLEARFTHETALALGLRIIATDRPGYGGSTQRPDRTLCDWVPNASALAGYLGLDRFAVVGISGGAPYALACAAALQDRITRVCIVSPMGPLEAPGALDEFDVVRRLSLYLAGRRSPLMRGLLRGAVGPLIARHADRFVAALAKGAGAADGPSLARAETQAGIAASFREGLRRGAGGAARDLELYASPWGVDFDSITAPVALWHGEDDRIIPPWLARQLAARLPTVTPRFVPGAGHYSLPLEHLTTILGEMVRP
jgi:pimeloyl-ACP methyl ester carboxylesterase